MAPLTFAFTLLLVVAVTTVKVKGSGVEDFQKLPAHSEHHSFYDVITEANMADLKASLSNLTLDHSYKVIGEPRYLITFRSNDPEALLSLTFPPGSRVTQVPVERGERYLEMLGVEDTGSWDFPENSTVSKTLLFCDWTLQPPPEGLCRQSFEMEVKSWVGRTKEEVALVKPAFYPVMATYPPRILSFWSVDENSYQNAAKASLSDFGGVGSTRAVIKRIIKMDFK